MNHRGKIYRMKFTARRDPTLTVSFVDFTRYANQIYIRLRTIIAELM